VTGPAALSGVASSALSGVTVVSIEQAVAAPPATRHLADLGARVIKVERPGAGDFARGYDRTVNGQASYFVWLNRGKESIALDLMDPGGAYGAYGGQPPQRTGSRHATIAPYGPFRVAGNEEIFLAVQNNREWERLCAEVLGQPGLATNPRFAHNPERVANADQLKAVIENALAGMAFAEARERLDAAGIASTAVRSPADLETHPQLAARRRWAHVATPGGLVRALRSPLLPDGGPDVIGEVPAAGQHTERIIAELAARPGGGGVAAAGSRADSPASQPRAEVLPEVPALALAGLLGSPLPRRTRTGSPCRCSGTGCTCWSVPRSGISGPTGTRSARCAPARS